MSGCISCGRPANGLRCRACNGLFIQQTFAQELAEQDTQLLAMRDEEGLSYRRLSERLNISPTRARQRVRDARRRTDVRAGTIQNS